MQIKALVGILISSVLIIALIFSVEWASVWVALQQMKLWPLLPAAILFILQYYLRAIRWRLLLPGTTNYSTRSLFDSIMVGCLANFLLPLRAGEFIRPFLLTRYANVSFSSALVSVVVERFFDLALVLALFSAVTVITPGIPNELNIGAAALGTMAAGILLIIILGSFMEARLLSIFDLLSKPLPEKLRDPLRKFSKDFLDGAAVLKTPLRAFLVVLSTIGVWALILALYLVFFWLFDIFPNFEAVLAVTVITALAVALPSAPGFVGVYQWACIASFALFSFPAEKAVAFSIITHVFHFAAYLLFGGIVLWRDGLKLADLKPSAKAVE